MASEAITLRTVLLMLLAGGGAAYAGFTLWQPAAPAPVSQAAMPVTPAAPAIVPPSFDVVRVAPSGTAVLAGRAEPGAEVTVRDGAVPLGQARADARGEWVIVPAAPLAEGGRELTLAARTPDGTETKGADTVVLAIPAPMAAPAAPVQALLIPGAGSPRVLQAPAQPGPARLGLGTVDYDERGEIRFSGTAVPNAPVQLFVDNMPAGRAMADAAGQWALRPAETLAAGVHKLRVEQVDGAGRVQSRIELPFQRTTLAPEDLAAGRTIVQPGQNLWRMARRTYGSGVRYTVIYLANKDQIRDPRLIYPGQAFALPTP